MHRISISDSENRTYLECEEACYPAGGQTRQGRAIYPDGAVRRVWAGIPDTFWTIPCHGKWKGKYVAGFLTSREDDGALVFNVYKKYTGEV